MSSKSQVDRHLDVVGTYQAACPDVLHVEIAGRPQLNGDYVIGADGRIKLGPDGGVRIEGIAVGEIPKRIAVALEVPAGSVTVKMVEYNSQHVILLGEVKGSQRVHPYQGQETVLELLQRTGGITRGAAPDSVYVVRPHVENGQRPEIFHVDLAAIVEKKDDKTNIRLLPYDQIHVGETRQSLMENVLPPWLRPFYQNLWGTRPEQPEIRERPPRTPRPRWFSLFPRDDKKDKRPNEATPKAAYGK